MPPLGNPSAISYSRSSARSDLKIFTFPLASYNSRMRAICDVWLEPSLFCSLQMTSPFQVGGIAVSLDEFIMFLFFFVSYLFCYDCLAVNSVSLLICFCEFLDQVATLSNTPLTPAIP